MARVTIPATDQFEGEVLDQGGAALNAKASPYKATGDGVTDDTAALQAWLDDVAVHGDGHLPDGVYVTDGSLLLSPDRDIVDTRIRFGAEAWLAPTAGWGLKATGAFKLVLDKPKVRLNTGTTATRGIWIVDSRWPEVHKPVIWAYAEIPSGFIGIDVDDNSYWAEIQFPVMRKNSGSIVSNFAKGVRFRDQSNAGTVWGGSLNHCDDGVYVDGSNACAAIRTAFEDCTDGVEFAESSIAPGTTNGGLVLGCRFETVTNDVNISATTVVSNGSPFQVVDTIYSSNNLILNPNGQPLRSEYRGAVRIRDNDQAFELRNGDVRFRDNTGHGHIESNGNIEIIPDFDNNGAGAFRVRDANGGALRIVSDPTGLGFFGVATVAKPTTGVAEAAFVENAGGTAVNVDSTFGGYTIQQIVQALRNLGLLT